MSSVTPPGKFVLPAVLGAAIGLPAVSWALATYSPDFKNNLTRFGLALPERVSDQGLAMGTDPAVMLGGSALITWAGVVLVVIAVVYIIAATRYEEFAESYEIDSPPEPGTGVVAQGYDNMYGQMPGGMPGQMPGYGAPMGYPGGMPGQMPGYGAPMPPMQQIPPHMGGPQQ